MSVSNDIREVLHNPRLHWIMFSVAFLFAVSVVALTAVAIADPGFAGGLLLGVAAGTMMGSMVMILVQARKAGAGARSVYEDEDNPWMVRDDGRQPGMTCSKHSVVTTSTLGGDAAAKEAQQVVGEGVEAMAEALHSAADSMHDAAEAISSSVQKNDKE